VRPCATHVSSCTIDELLKRGVDDPELLFCVLMLTKGMRSLFTSQQVDDAKEVFKETLRLILPNDAGVADELADDFWKMRFQPNSRGEFTSIDMETLKTIWNVYIGVRAWTNNVTERSKSFAF
jgi:hypothetical protein